MFSIKPVREQTSIYGKTTPTRNDRYRRWTEVFVTMADMRVFKIESRNSFIIYSPYVKRHYVTGSVQVGGLSQRFFLCFSAVCICLHSKQARVNEDGQKRKRTDPRGKTHRGRLIPPWRKEEVLRISRKF